MLGQGGTTEMVIFKASKDGGRKDPPDSASIDRENAKITILGPRQASPPTFEGASGATLRHYGRIAFWVGTAREPSHGSH